MTSRSIAKQIEKAPTILDVAAAAGVSKSTVSNVVRAAPAVSAATRRRVLDAIDRLGYKPNAIARHFVTRRTMILGVVAGDLGDPYHAQLIHAVEREALRAGYATMLCNIDGDQGEQALDVLLAHRVAGVIVLSLTTAATDVGAAIRDAGIPVVAVGAAERSADSIGPDDTAAVSLVTEHLLALGHRRIAYVRTPLVGAAADRSRHRAYAAALRAARVRPLPIHAWTPGSSHVVVGRRTIDLASVLGPAAAPTAAFVSNDAGAIALIDACEARGIHVPADLSVVGFDDIAIARHRRISLTTVARPLEHEAERAVSLLLDRIEDLELAPRHEQVELELRERGSTAPPVR